jgi:hypothetical protein
MHSTRCLCSDALEGGCINELRLPSAMSVSIEDIMYQHNLCDVSCVREGCVCCHNALVCT